MGTDFPVPVESDEPAEFGDFGARLRERRDFDRREGKEGEDLFGRESLPEEGASFVPLSFWFESSGLFPEEKDRRVRGLRW